MKKNLTWKLVFSILLLLLTAAEIYAVISLIRLDMLPPVYLAILIAVFAVFTLVVGLMLFLPGKTNGKGRKIAACVLSVLLLCGCAVIITVAGDVVKTLEATSQILPDIATREIYVRTNDSAEDIEDTAGYTFGYVKNFDESCTQQVIEKLQQKLEGPVATAGYTNMFTMVNALIENRIDAMILNGGYVSILEETEGFLDFSAQTRVLMQVRVEEPEEILDVTEPVADPEETEDTTETAADPQNTQPEEDNSDITNLKPFIVYLSGSDSYDAEIVKAGRSDVNILAVINPMTKQVLLVNTPRDYYVENTGADYGLDKLTHCGIYGIKCSMSTLSNLYNEKIDYYVRINFTGFKKMIDALGGVTVYSEYPFTAIERTEIKEGWNDLNGQQALDFARERYTIPGGDNARGQHQMQVIKAVIKKATSGTTIISNYSEILASVEGMFQMDIPAELISDMMKMQLTDMAQWNVVTYAATGYNSMEECASALGMDLAVIIPHQSSVSKATRLIDMVFAGELLTEEVINSITE